MKKVISLALVFIFLFPFAVITLADEDDMNGTVSAPGFVAIDASDPDHLIYAKNPDKQLAPASTTKIMTCILALENCPDLDEIIEIDPSATRLGSTNTLMGLKKGERLPIRQLLYGLMLPSGNDAAIAIACHISGDVESFAELMNEKAAELGMINTHFVTASGVYKGNHYSTARDMATLAAYAMQNETFREIVSTAKYTVPANEVRKKELKLENTNNLIQESKSEYYKYAIGCKTGSTVQGGKCLVAAAEKDGTTLIVVLLGLTKGGSKGQRIHKCFKDAATVFENIFSMYHSVTLDELDPEIANHTYETLIENASVNDPGNGMLDLIADFSNQSVSLPSDAINAIQTSMESLDVSIEFANDMPTAPIAKNTEIGTVYVSYRNRVLFSSSLLASRDVAEFIPEPSSTSLPSQSPGSSTSVVPSGISSSNLKRVSGPEVFLILFIVLLLITILIIAVILLIQKLRSKR